MEAVTPLGIADFYNQLITQLGKQSSMRLLLRLGSMTWAMHYFIQKWHDMLLLSRAGQGRAGQGRAGQGNVRRRAGRRADAKGFITLPM